MELTDDEVLRMLWAAREAPFIYLDGHELHKPTIAAATSIATQRGWLDLGELHEGDQWAWYLASITDTGRAAIEDWYSRNADSNVNAEEFNKGGIHGQAVRRSV